MLGIGGDKVHSPRYSRPAKRTAVAAFSLHSLRYRHGGTAKIIVGMDKTSVSGVTENIIIENTGNQLTRYGITLKIMTPEFQNCRGD